MKPTTTGSHTGKSARNNPEKIQLHLWDGREVVTVVESALREEEIEFGEIDRKTGSGIDLLKTLAVLCLYFDGGFGGPFASCTVADFRTLSVFWF